jgi:hypothetical protein
VPLEYYHRGFGLTFYVSARMVRAFFADMSPTGKRESAVHGADHAHRTAAEYVGVNFRGSDVLVAEQLLDGADVIAFL